MNQKSIIALALALLSGVAHAGKVYDGYDAFFNDQPGQLFRSPFSRAYLPESYGPNGDATASWEGKAGNVRLKLELTSRSIRINDRDYSFADAVRLHDDKRTDMDARAVTLYVATNADAASPEVCIEATGTGSGTADRYRQVYVIATRSRSGAHLFKLPSLFGSCRSLVRQRGALQFPEFSYRRAPDVDDPIGTEVQYFAIDGKRYVPTDRHFSTRFTEPANVFKFEVE